MGTVSVVVSTYNRAHFLAECLESLLGQTRPATRIVVVDDGSSDNTAEVVSQFAGSVDYIRKENGGKASALNLALTTIDTEFVWFFDDDDVAYPWAIESHLAIHNMYPGLGFSFGFHDLGISGLDGRIVVSESPPPPEVFGASLGFQRLNLMRFCSFMLTSCIIRTQLFRQGKYFREELLRSQDYAALIELSQCANFAYTGTRTYIFRQHEGLRGSALISHSYMEKRLIWMKYDRLIGDTVIKPLPLNCFLPDSKSNFPDSIVERRAALIRRAWVFASKADVIQVISDLEAACLECPTESLNESDCSFLETLPDHPYFIQALQGELKSFISLLRLSGTTVGRTILGALGKGFYRLFRFDSTVMRGFGRTEVATCMLAFLPFTVLYHLYGRVN